MESIILVSKFVGAMIGTAVGDAVGELAFRNSNRELLERAIGDTSVLQYTDDTAMTIALAESLIRKGDVDQDHIGRTFAFHFQKEPWRGYASGPPTVFSMVERHRIPYVKAAEALEGGAGSFGNGAAMRVTPVGLRFFNAEDLHKKAAASAAVTHAHPIGKDGAGIQALAIGHLVKLDSLQELNEVRMLNFLIRKATTPEIREKLEQVRGLLAEGVSPRRAARGIGRSVAMHESMPFSLYSFLKNPKDFKECIYCAVLNGGDRDTLGAMAGALLGAYLGKDAIPNEWYQKVENREYIEDLALKLLPQR